MNARLLRSPTGETVSSGCHLTADSDEIDSVGRARAREFDDLILRFDATGTRSNLRRIGRTQAARRRCDEQSYAVAIAQAPERGGP
jgi:hypothetical protein